MLLFIVSKFEPFTRLANNKCSSLIRIRNVGMCFHDEPIAQNIDVLELSHNRIT